MRLRGWTPLVCLAGAVTAGGLLFDRAPSALGWAALPLVGWMVAATLTRPALLSAAVQTVVVVVIAVAVAAALWVMVDWTRLGAMIRAGVDDAPIARVVGIRVSRLFTLVFALGAALAAFAGVVGAPILSVYPGLDADMLPLALIVVILGGTGSLLGALVGSFLIGFLYNFGQARFPDLAYVILFLPMLLVLVLRPQGLFGKGGS